nr:hypothetical protein [Marinicella sp. W31]MDC2879881.1 hypothetical protein [Marinicella sp. W31]
MPEVMEARADGARGFANPGDYVVASCVDRGVIAWVKTAPDADWALDWLPLPPWSDKTMLVQFTAYSSLTGAGINTPSSCSAFRYADKDSSQPPKPTIEGYENSVFNGTEAMDNTTIVVWNRSDNDNAVGLPSQKVANSRWTVTAFDPPASGEVCYAVATETDEDSNPGATSLRSEYYTVP